jgi:hypothetical protein
MLLLLVPELLSSVRYLAPDLVIESPALNGIEVEASYLVVHLVEETAVREVKFCQVVSNGKAP